MHDPSVKNTVSVLRVPITTCSKKEVLEHCREQLLRRNPSACMSIVTPNPEIIMQAQENKSLLEALQQATLQVADGIGVIWAAKLLLRETVHRLTGVELMYELCKIANELETPVFFLGAEEGVAKLCVHNLTSKLPKLKVVGVFSGDSKTNISSMPEQIQEEIRIARVIFVAFGAPKQELWIQNNVQLLPKNSIVMTVGGAFDFYAGRVRRAPKWVRLLGFEWLYRLLQQPWRWRRMLALPRFCFQVLTGKMRNFVKK
jgi:N-acetylglucosaminyldiphosphoundecaprenol N-acetyl-beta-D-mannosaminyltransferase